MKLKSLTVRLDELLLAKIRYVADYEGRSINQQIIQWSLEHIREFEKREGMIETDTQKTNG